MRKTKIRNLQTHNIITNCFKRIEQCYRLSFIMDKYGKITQNGYHLLKFINIMLNIFNQQLAIRFYIKIQSN